MLDPIPVSPSGHASPQFSERITSKSVDRIIETTSMREGRLRTDRRLMILRRTTQGTSSLNSVASWDSPVIGTDQVIMFSAWQKLSKEKQFLWTLISGGIVIGSVMKVSFVMNEMLRIKLFSLLSYSMPRSAFSRSRKTYCWRPVHGTNETV